MRATFRCRWLAITGFMVVLLVASSELQAQNQIVSAGYSIPEPPAFAAGQVVTLFVRGLNVPDATANGFPLPTTLAGISVRVKSGISGYPEQLPIFSVRTYDFCAGRIGASCSLTHVTVQIPTEPTCVPMGQIPNECTIGPPAVITLNVQLNGLSGEGFPVVVNSAPHILNACDTIFGIGGICTGIVTHGDGLLVKGNNPARPGETIVIYAVGLGTTPAVKTGEPSPSQSPKFELNLPLIVSYRLNLPPASSAPPVVWSPVTHWVNPAYIGLVSGYVGLNQINVAVPADIPQNLSPCGGEWGINTRIAIGAGGFGPTDGQTSVDVCVQR